MNGAILQNVAQTWGPAEIQIWGHIAALAWGQIVPIILQPGKIWSFFAVKPKDILSLSLGVVSTISAAVLLSFSRALLSLDVFLFE